MKAKTEHKRLVGESKNGDMDITYEIEVTNQNEPARMKVYFQTFDSSFAYQVDGAMPEPVLNLSICEVEALANELKEMLDWLSRTGGLVSKVDQWGDDAGKATYMRQGSALNR